MKKLFYPKLALDGIRKNKRLYFPYILTGSVMVMMFYILSFLIESPALEEMRGGSILMSVLPLGCIVVAIFSLIFLFYTNSFLIRQRYREFGLYNVLGMDKHNIGRIMVWETVFTVAAVIMFGSLSGVALSKMAELAVMNLLGREINYQFSIGWLSLRNTARLYVGIYMILLLNSLIKIGRSKPLELMQSDRVGEKAPKSNWLLALAGLVLLGTAYYMAVTIEEPVTAMFTFFIAVVLVIFGTYLLFVAGSVTFCRLLQKNKRYYYQPNHFVSVSSMAYRMKRNGAGLASICILMTMVLVTVSSTATLYFGEEEALQNRYPYNVNIKVTYRTIDGISDGNVAALQDLIREEGGDQADLTGIRSCSTSGLFTDSGIIINVDNRREDVGLLDYDNIGYLYAISLDDYNHLMGTDKTLAPDECFVYCAQLQDVKWETFGTEYGPTYKVKERLTEFKQDEDSLVQTMTSAYLIVSDLTAFAQPVMEVKNSYDLPVMLYSWRCGFDTQTTEEETTATQGIYSQLKAMREEGVTSLSSFYVESRAANRDSFFDIYGSLFFLGAMLSAMFLLAAVLIIYYKQLSEGYEDQKRFEIMQKVGMTRRDIRKSVDSQVLTVFFLPLILAGLHMVFAFPFLSKILVLFAFDNTLFNALVTLGCYALFGVFYTVVYKITSGSYYNIVCGIKEE